MHKRYQRGFTLIELMTVIVIIALLTMISILAYAKVQAGAHDTKRADDITAMQHELEKYYTANGEYPPGCNAPNSSGQCVTYSGTVSNNDPTSFNTSSAVQIAPTTSLTQLRQMLPGLSSSFGDPLNTGTTPILNDTANSAFEYVYFGGITNNTSSTKTYNPWLYSNNNQSWALPISCNPAFTLAPGQASTYIIGYYSESDHTWHLRHGTYGIQPSYLNQIPNNVIWCWNTGANAQWAN